MKSGRVISLFVVWLLLCLAVWIEARYSKTVKESHRSAEEKQDFLIKTLGEFDITYPTELDHRDEVIDHVTTLSSHRRRRRSLTEEAGPIIYQVQFKGKTIKLNLRINTLLFGSDFTTERYKEDGTIERTKSSDLHCYLVGETESFYSSVAISDCDGLAGIIDLGNDTIYIEPVLNKSLVTHRGWTRPGRPHLMYRKAVLEEEDPHNLEFDEFQTEDYPTGLKADGEPNEAEAARSLSAYLQIINRSGRAIKMYYVFEGKEKYFRILTKGATLEIDTYTVHKWIAKDYDTGKALFLNRQKTYTPPTGTNAKKPANVYVTIPPGLKLPDPLGPAQPNSHITFINKSNRFVKIYYIEDGETRFFSNLSPAEEMHVNTFTSHRWFAKDLDTGKSFLVNGEKQYIPRESHIDRRIHVAITVPSTISLPDMKFPEMVKTQPKYIEVMAAADSSVVKFHGKEKAEKYVLTLMNIVSRIFQHKSIGAPIYFVVVKLVLLERDPREIKITGKPMASLSSVCYWGHKTRKGFDKVDKDFYDQTVFLTRKDFGPSGYAPVHGMCYRVRSCTLNEEDGFTSSFIIAHETGHTLGMEHDGVKNNCSNDVIKGSIMAPLVRSRFDRFYWSSCSRRDLITKLRALWCIDDVPFRNEIPYLKKLPGQIYSIDEQCQREFGKNTRFCSGMKRDPCKELWCSRLSFSTYNNRFCQTRRTAALEGTKCGVDKWCRLGECVPVDDDEDISIPLPRPKVKPVHGGWSEWSGLSECSKPCGVGIRYQTRKCNNPVPKNLGRPCEGEDAKFELCNTEDCPGQLLTFEASRNEQCKRRAPLILPEIAGNWAAHDIFKASIDCDFETGLCGWTNDAHDNYDWKHNKGRTPTAGTGPSADHTKGRDGHYVFLETSRPLNPRDKARLISPYIGLKVACLKFWYHSFGDNAHMGELQLIIKSDTGEKIVWAVNRNRGDNWVWRQVTIFSKRPYRIVFQGVRGDGYLSDFALDDISLENNPCGLGMMRFTTINNRLDLNPCQQFCEATENGKRVDIVPLDVENGTKCNDDLTSFDVCIQSKCQKVGCDGIVGSNKTLDNCGVCGGDGHLCTPSEGSISLLPKEDLQTLLECPVGSTNIMLEDTSPNFLVLEAMGAEKQYLNGAEVKSVSSVFKFAGAKFIYTRHGNKESLNALGPLTDRIKVKVKISESSAPVTLRYSLNKPNSNGSDFYWSHLKWSECSRTCGEGIQTRIYRCLKREDDNEVSEKNCSTVNKPEPLIRPCNLTACERYEWRVSEWSDCSKPCDRGKQNRTVECKGVLGKMLVNSSLCTADKPEIEQICNDDSCPAKWVTGNWSECSRTCGSSYQSRSVECRDILGALSLNCPRETKEGIIKRCRKEPCAGEDFVNISCTFEQGLCGWENVRGSSLDQFDWTLWNGSTPSRKTGPSVDHTHGTSKGFYVYIEASDPQKRNYRARLASPLVKAKRVCIDFWYHMYGANMGSLRVIYRDPKSRRERRLWYKSKNQLNEWHNERLLVSSYLPYQIIFEAVRGRGFSSDVALDDIKVSSGSCPSKNTKTPQNRCIGDRSKYCKTALRLNWCSSRKWGPICCKTCDLYAQSGSK